MTLATNSRRLITGSLAIGVLFSITVSASFAAEPPAKKPAKKAVLTFKRIGGFAGFHDDVMIYSDGTFEKKAPRHRPKSGSKGTLDAKQKASLDKLLATFGAVRWSRGNKPGVADGMQEAITISGSGKQTKLDPRAPEFRQIQKLVGGILRPAAK